MALPALNPLVWLFYLINAGLYGFSDVIARDLIEIDTVGDFGNVLLFQLLMVLVMLIMLNLLIAIMNSAYESVRTTATLEVMHEKASIIQDAERFFLPTLLKRLKIEASELFPTWLHLLVPREKLHEMNLSNRRDVPSKNHDTKQKEGPMIISVAQNSQTKGLGATAGATDSTTVRANASLPADLMTRPVSTNNAAPPATTPGKRTTDVVELVPTQKTVLSRWGDRIRTSGDVYAKMTQIHAKEAIDNGVLETVVDGDVETRKTYEKGDIIMCGSEGQRYTTNILGFSLRYDLNAPEPASNLTLAEEGFQLYRAIGKIFALELSHDESADHFPAGEFMASWYVGRP